MVRAVTVLSLLFALLAGAYLFVAGTDATGPASPAGGRVQRQGTTAAAAVNLQQATAALEQNRAATGTYAGTSLAGFGGVALVRADAASYCIQSGAFHEAGPGGSPAPGPC